MKFRISNKSKSNNCLQWLKERKFIKYSEILEETLSYFSNTSISEEEYWQIYEYLTKNKPFCMIMCWSIFGTGENIKEGLELHKKTPNNSKLIFMDNLQDESWRKYIKERKIVIIF